MSLLEKSFILDVFLLPYFIIRLMETVTPDCLTCHQIDRKRSFWNCWKKTRPTANALRGHTFYLKCPLQKTVQDLKTNSSSGSKYFDFDACS